MALPVGSKPINFGLLTQISSEEMLMTKNAAFAALFGALALSLCTIVGSNASAAPLAPSTHAAQLPIIAVAGGCGAGWHRGPFGRCVRNLTPIWRCWFAPTPRGMRKICR
jgi:predicted ABC-type sugar transport system permease subunit